MPELRPPYAPIRVPKTLSVGQEIVLDAGAAKSIAFREINEKEAFTLCDETRTFFRASVLSASPQKVLVTIYEKLPVSPESTARITLVCAVLARQRMLFVAQKATELGVARIVPVFTKHSVGPAGLAHEKSHAWPGQVLRAARQCRRASIPELLPAKPLAEIYQAPYFVESTRRFALDDRVGQLTDLSAPADAAALEVVLVVGPEGGFSDEERERLAAEGAMPLRLGGRVLRAETAVIVGLSVLQWTLGDLGGRAAG